MDILFEDDYLIAVNKPSGLLTIRDGYNPDLPTVKSTLEKDLGRCWIVHRLDKETSGVLIVAKNNITHRSMSMQFENHQINKIYHAFISGCPPETKFVIDLPLVIDGDRRHRTVINNEKGKTAKTSITVIKSTNDYTLVKAEPETGYTHQIRAHLSYSGFPLLGDKLYANDKSFQDKIIGRTALHAYQITFIHPFTNQPLTISADYPEDFELVLASLH